MTDYRNDPMAAAKAFASPPVDMSSDTPALSIAALVLGIIAIVGSFIPLVGFLGIPFAVAAVVLGIIGVKAANGGKSGRGLAATGIALGPISLLIDVIWLLLVLSV